MPAYGADSYSLGIHRHLVDTSGVLTLDAQTITIIVTLAGLMIALARMNNKHTDQRIDDLRTDLDELKAAVVRLEDRVYDLATARRTPFIVPNR